MAGVALSGTGPLESLDEDGKEKFLGRKVCPLRRTRALLGVTVFVGAWVVDTTRAVLRRAALLEVGRMKFGIWPGRFCARLPMVLRRGKGGFELGCMSAR